MAYKSFRRAAGIGYQAQKKLIRSAVSAGKRAARRTTGTKGKNMWLILLAGLGVAAYFFRSKLTALFNKKKD